MTMHPDYDRLIENLIEALHTSDPMGEYRESLKKMLKRDGVERIHLCALTC